MLPQISTRTKLNVSRLFNELKKIPQTDWCDYLVDRDFLAGRITANQRREIIAGAITCGQELARKVRHKYGEITAGQLAYQLNCTVEHADNQKIHEQIFLATFTEPSQIKLYDEPIQKLVALKLPDLNEDLITQIVLSHELFHYFEGQDRALYSQTTQIELWHLFNYHHRTTIRSTSEIAAMSFSWALNDLAFSPLVIDLLTLACYNQTAAQESLVALQKNQQIS